MRSLDPTKDLLHAALVDLGASDAHTEALFLAADWVRAAGRPLDVLLVSADIPSIAPAVCLTGALRLRVTSRYNDVRTKTVVTRQWPDGSAVSFRMLCCKNTVYIDRQRADIVIYPATISPKTPTALRTRLVRAFYISVAPQMLRCPAQSIVFGAADDVVLGRLRADVRAMFCGPPIEYWTNASDVDCERPGPRSTRV